MQVRILSPVLTLSYTIKERMYDFENFFGWMFRLSIVGAVVILAVVVALVVLAFTVLL